MDLERLAIHWYDLQDIRALSMPCPRAFGMGKSTVDGGRGIEPDDKITIEKGRAGRVGWAGGLGGLHLFSLMV